MDPTSIDRLINTAEAAQLLGISPKTLESQRVRPGGVSPPYIKLGRLVRYRFSDIQALIAAGQRTSTSDPGIAA